LIINKFFNRKKVVELEEQLKQLTFNMDDTKAELMNFILSKAPKNIYFTEI
jgi:hypothetical protein